MAAPSNRIGRYEIIEPLGRGGMNPLFLARDPALNRVVVIKLFLHDDEGLRTRFARQARAVTRLNHPNIVTLFDADEHEGHPFIAMEYIRGETLAEIIRQRKPLSLTRKIQIIEDVCAGLEYGHAAGFVHGSITPATIMVAADGPAKILDFGGLATLSAGMTQSGMLVETPNYMSPEQIAGSAVDRRSDVFATGAVLYELITYQKAFVGENFPAIWHHIITAEPVRAASLVPDLPADLDRIIASSLKKDPSERYADVAMLRRDLSRVRHGIEGPQDVDAPTMMRPPSAPSGSPRFGGARESLERRRSAQIEQLLAEGQRYFDQSRFEDSISACDQILMLDDGDARAALLADRARAALEERERAADEMRRASEESKRREVEAARVRAEQESRRRAEEGGNRAEADARRRAEEDARRGQAEAGPAAGEPARRMMPDVVPVFYATDRARTGRTTEPVAYGSERSLAGLAYGCTFVSIPPGHRRGHLERPSILRLEFREDSARHIVSLNVTEYTKDTFFDLLRKAMAGPDERSTFVFIHGFNVEFNEAVRRTAQLGFDLGLRKAPILYSWPSQGSALQYIADTNAAMWTVPHLAEFLRDLQEQSGATSVHLIAHSMGNQALIGALRMLQADRSSGAGIFKQVVLTAPDLDAHVFERDLAPQIVGMGERTTLYASSRDEVLSVSKRLNAYRRAGDAAEGIVVVDGVDSIDASAVSTGLGHSAYGDVRTVVEDLSLLLRLGLAPGKRNLVAHGLPPRQHWAFPA